MTRAGGAWVTMGAGLAGCASDPAPGVWHTRAESRQLACARLSQTEAHDREPGRVPEVPARQLPGVTEALLCQPLYLPEGERPARDEAILSTLRHDVGELTQLASTLTEGDVTFHVDAFYPAPEIASKIAFAAKNELVEHGRVVSDRVPLLAAGDVSVLVHLPQARVYAAACTRYFAEHTLGEHDVFLGLMLLDERETHLHAGLCQAGQWRWVR